MTATAAAPLGGLVPSINNAETQGDWISVEKLQARCTRLRKNLGIAAKWLSQGGGQCYMLTFTYKRVEDWKPAQVRDCLTLLRKWLLRAYKWRLRYLWVMETQRRKSGDQIGQSAPHYHCVVWVPVQVQKDDLKFDERGWWPHGLTNAVKAVAPVRYVMKYASKFDNAGAFPKGARIYGVGGMDVPGAQCRRWVNWPSFVQGIASASCSFARATGGGWVNRRTGEWWPSEWGLSFRDSARAVLVRLHTHTRVIQACGPFNWLPAFAGQAA